MNKIKVRLEYGQYISPDCSVCGGHCALSVSNGILYDDGHRGGCWGGYEEYEEYIDTETETAEEADRGKK